MDRLIDAQDAFNVLSDYYHHSTHVQHLALQEALNKVPTVDAVPHWIPCSERLPEDDRSKVVTLANGNAEVGYYSNGDWWCVGDKFTLENPTVIAWMPLPEPYKGDKE